jgi:hypothetical protein
MHRRWRGGDWWWRSRPHGSGGGSGDGREMTGVGNQPCLRLVEYGLAHRNRQCASGFRSFFFGQDAKCDGVWHGRRYRIEGQLGTKKYATSP